MSDLRRLSGRAWPEPLTTLLYELLDAHLDTVDLAKDLLEERWRAHLDYLRALQRRGRELLADAAMWKDPASAEMARNGFTPPAKGAGR